MDIHQRSGDIKRLETMKLVNLQYFITRNGLRELCCKRSETHYTNVVAIVATNGSLPLRAVPRKLVPLTPDPHDSSSQMDKTYLIKLEKDGNHLEMES